MYLRKRRSGSRRRRSARSRTPQMQTERIPPAAAAREGSRCRPPTAQRQDRDRRAAAQQAVPRLVVSGNGSRP